MCHGLPQKWTNTSVMTTSVKITLVMDRGRSMVVAQTHTLSSILLSLVSHVYGHDSFLG
jgi:hypothetical protein